MSRVGRVPVAIPNGVSAQVTGNVVTVKGPKGTITKEMHNEMKITVEDGKIAVTRPSDGRLHRSLHGLTRTLIANMVKGVTEGYEKSLDIGGVGYKAAKQGNKLVLNVGYSHPVEIENPQGIEIDVPVPTKVVVRGIDKGLVGQTAADIRAVRRPEPYKGKGIRYTGERVRTKAGKTGKAQK